MVVEDIDDTFWKFVWSSSSCPPLTRVLRWSINFRSHVLRWVIFCKSPQPHEQGLWWASSLHHYKLWACCFHDRWRSYLEAPNCSIWLQLNPIGFRRKTIDRWFSLSQNCTSAACLLALWKHFLNHHEAFYTERPTDGSTISIVVKMWSLNKLLSIELHRTFREFLDNFQGFIHRLCQAFSKSISHNFLGFAILLCMHGIELQHFTTHKPSEFTSVSVRGTEKFHGAKHHREHRKQQEVLQQSGIIWS